MSVAERFAPKEQGEGWAPRLTRRHSMCSRDIRSRGCIGPRARIRASHRRAGISLVEILVALSVMVVAGSIFCQMLIATTRLRQVNRENALAADAARVVLERMRNEPFLEIFRDYNEDPKDDPGGEGTGPGHLFDVHGLEAVDGASRVGRVTFPSMAVTVTSGGGGKQGMLGGSTTIQQHLREDYQDAGLGMPRDLDGDNKIDTSNHGTNYLILPVRVAIEWKSGTGARKFEIVTQLGDFRREDE